MRNENAQITIDYITGIGIFLLAIAFVFQFMFNLFAPFYAGSDEVTLASDRVSSVIVERLLNNYKSETLNVVEQSDLDYFINTRLNYSNQTIYNNALQEVGIFSDYIIFDLNVSVANLTFLDSPMYQGGPVLPDNIDVGQTKRVILIVNASTGYNETGIISVRVW